jgi:hypothetical protein
VNQHDFPFTTTTALASISSPLWLHNMSDAATQVLPLLGCAWLLLQAYVYIRDNIWKKPKE